MMTEIDEKIEYIDETLSSINYKLKDIDEKLSIVDPSYLKDMTHTLSSMNSSFEKQKETLSDAYKQLLNMILEFKGVVATTRTEFSMTVKRNKKRKAIAKAIQEYYES